MDFVSLIDELCAYSTEQSWFDFKTNLLEPVRLGEMISGIHNYIFLKDMLYGYIVYGIHDDPPHDVVGTNLHVENLRQTNGQELPLYLMNKLSPSPYFTFHNVEYKGEHLMVLVIKNNQREPVSFDSVHHFRTGQSTIDLNRHRTEILRELFIKSKERIPFEKQIAAENVPQREIFDSLLHWQSLYDLRDAGKGIVEYPKTYIELIADFSERGFIIEGDRDKHYSITNLGALMFAKDLSKYENLNSRRVRVIEYDGIDKQITKDDYTGFMGYAPALNRIIAYIIEKVPTVIRVINAQRLPLPIYPVLALREFIANALVHQDFGIKGVSPVISIYNNRIEITNPGIPEIDIDRFIDTNRARNEVLVERMRELHLCEMQGSGIDNALQQIGQAYLPAPKFSIGDVQFSAVLFAPQEFDKINTTDRMRICFQHCVLQWVKAESMTNETLRERLGIKKEKSNIASKIITDTVESGKIKALDSNASKKNKRYVPHWHREG